MDRPKKHSPPEMENERSISMVWNYLVSIWISKGEGPTRLTGHTTVFKLRHHCSQTIAHLTFHPQCILIKRVCRTELGMLLFEIATILFY
jgi:hypothetical protein